MFYLILPITFLAVSIPLIEPLNLFRSSVIVSVTLLFFLGNRIKFTKQIAKTPAVMIMILIIGYIFSGIANNQSIASQMLGSYNRNQGLLIWVSFILIFIMAQQNTINSNQFFKFGINPVLILSVVYGFIQLLKFDPIVWAESGIVLTLGNSNFAAPLLVILGIYCLSQILEAKKKSNYLFYVISGISTIVLGLETKTLQYPALVLFSLFIFLLLYRKNLEKLKFRLSNFILVFSFLFSALVTAFNWNIVYSAGNAVDRIDSIRAAFLVWLDHPIFGVGIEQLFMFSPEFRTQRQFEAYGSSVVVDKAHNIFIDHLSNGGILVGTAVIGYTLWILTLIFKVNKTQLSASQRSKFALLSTIWFIWIGQASIGPDNNLLTLLGIISAGLISQFHYSKKVILTTGSRKAHLNSSISQNLAITIILLISLTVYSISIHTYREAKLITENEITDVKQIEKIVNRVPTPKMTEIILVHLIKNQKNCPYMYSLINDFKKQHSRSSQAYYFSAICKSFDKKDQSALNDIKMGLKYDPLNINLLIADFRLKYASNDIDGSKVAYRKIMTLDPKNQVLDGYPDFVPN